MEVPAGDVHAAKHEAAIPTEPPPAADREASWPVRPQRVWLWVIAFGVASVLACVLASVILSVVLTITRGG